MSPNADLALPRPAARRLALPSAHGLVVIAVFTLLALPLVATLGYALAASWGASLLPDGLTLKWFAELWTTFARTGRPAAEGVPEWPAYDLDTRPTMRIDSTCEVIYDRFSEELAMWRAIGRI